MDFDKGMEEKSQSDMLAIHCKYVCVHAHASMRACVCVYVHGCVKSRGRMCAVPQVSSTFCEFTLETVSSSGLELTG